MRLLNLRKYIAENRAELHFLLLFFTIWAPTTVNFFAVFLTKITGLEFVKSAFPTVLSICLICSSYNYWSKRIRGIDVLVYFLLVGTFVLNYIVDDTNSIMQDLFLPMFLTSSLVIFAGIAVDLNKLKLPLFYMSAINVALSAFYYLLFTQASTYSGSLESMTNSATSHIGDISYQVLPSVLYIIWFTFKDFKIFDCKTIINLFFALLGFILISSFGTRGPLVCLIVFVVGYIFFFSSHKNKYLVRIITVCAAVLCYIFLEPILLYMANLMQSLGMSSRIFVYALEGTFLGGEDSADERMMLLSEAKRVLDAGDFHTYFGYGFLGWSKCMSGYPHNFYYDIMTSFGYVFGGIFLLWLLVLFVKTATAKVPIDWKCMVFVVSSLGFLQLFMSGTFWGVPFFYLLIGLCLNITRKGSIAKHKYY